jgi:hypothetical protein
MKTTMSGVAAVVLLGAAITTTASAEQRGYSGTLCNGTDNNLMYTPMGVETTNLSSGRVLCGAAPLVGSDVNRIQATVYDRNPTADLCCTMIVLSADGLAITSALRCSSGNSNAAQLLSATFPTNVAGSVVLQCDIPPAAPTGASRVSTYRVRSTP